MGRLFWKFLFAFWLTLIVAAVGVGSAVWLHRQADFDEVAEHLSPRISFWLDTTESALVDGSPLAAGRLLDRWQQRRGGAPVFVVAPNGQDLIGRPLPPASTLAALPDNVQRTVTLADGQRFRLIVDPQHLRPRRGRPDRPPAAWIPLTSGLIASLAFSALLAWYVARPIRHLRHAFDAAANGQLDVRVTPKMGRRRDEIADLGRDFDHMAARLQAQINAQRRLLHDVSHELRSPLARMQAAIGLGRQNAARLPETLERIERESARLDTLVGELLTLARLEAGSDGRAERVELVELIAAIADDAQFEAQAAGCDLHFDGSGEAWTWAQASLVQRAYENVIRNAVKYTAPGTAVDVSLRVANGALDVSVADHGPGVPEDELAHIFEPFHRAGNGHPAPGFGLGLAIAQRALAAHGGSIGARLRPGGGLVVDLHLPLRDTPSPATPA